MLLKRISTLVVISALLFIQVWIVVVTADEMKLDLNPGDKMKLDLNPGDIWKAEKSDKGPIKSLKFTVPNLVGKQVLSNLYIVKYTVELVKPNIPTRLSIYRISNSKIDEPYLIGEWEEKSDYNHLAEFSVNLSDCDPFLGENAFGQITLNPGSPDQHQIDISAPQVIVNFFKSNIDCDNNTIKSLKIPAVATEKMENIDVRLKIYENGTSKFNKPKPIPVKYFNNKVKQQTNLTWDEFSRQFGDCNCSNTKVVPIASLKE